MQGLKTKLWDHQKKAIELAKHQRDYALFFEMGTGKTLTQIGILLDRYREANSLLRTLIFCPLVVVRNWKVEFGLHSDLPQTRIVLLEGSQEKRIKTFKRATERSEDCIFVSNYESLLMKNLFELYHQWQPEILVFDESHKLKAHNTKRTKQAVILADRAKRRYLLSGTPVLNSPMDLFSQYLVMDGGKSFTNNFYIFKAKYFYDANARMPKHIHFPNWKIREDASAKINKIVNTTSMRVEKSECLDLPPLVKEIHHVQMTTEQARLYKEMKNHFITYLNDKACVAQLALTKALRLQQIVSGFVKTAEGKEVTLKNTPRENALEDLLRELTPNHKVIVWSVFKHNFATIKRICEKLEVDYVEVHGGITAKNKQIAIERFTNDDRCRVFSGHPGAGGIGINLTVSDYSVYYSRTFSLEFDLQSEARNHRGGSERHQKITRIDLVCRDTIDELVQKRLAEKMEMGEKLLQAIEKELG